MSSRGAPGRRQCVLRTEERFDLIVEVHGYTRADVPDDIPQDGMLLAGVCPGCGTSSAAITEAQGPHDERSIKLNGEIAAVLSLRWNPTEAGDDEVP